MSSNTARAISTAFIWLAVAVVLTFGVFRMSWDGILGILLLPTSLAILCVSAWYATREVWKAEPLPMKSAQTDNELKTGELQGTMP